MLTKTFDYIRVMCAQYWPASLHREEEYCYENGDGFRVTVKEELHYASYIHRRMLLRRGIEQRQVVKIFPLSLSTTVPPGGPLPVHRVALLQILVLLN